MNGASEMSECHVFVSFLAHQAEMETMKLCG